MTAETLIAETSPIVATMGSAFYFHPETLARGKELGLDGFRWYVLGRGGVLGDVEAPVVTAAFGYFHPATIAKIWDSARAKLAPRRAGTEYLACAARFGAARFADLDLDAFCAAAQTVVDHADRAGLSLFAGIAAEPLDDDARGRALQLTAVLRELRGSAHLVAVLGSGLTAQEAHYLRRPGDYASFGWAEPPAVTDEHRSMLAAADALTDRLLVPAYRHLDEAQGRALVDGLGAMGTALGS